MIEQAPLLIGARLLTLDPTKIKAIVDWYCGGSGLGPDTLPQLTEAGVEGTVLWVLAEQTDGQLIARVDGQGRWVVATLNPEVTPDRGRLRWLRCFSEVGEVLIWLDGEPSGRRLDPLESGAAREIGAPVAETLLVMGERLAAGTETENGVSILEDAGGWRLAVPLSLPEPELPYPVVLEVVHHRRQAADGAIGAGETRLVRLRRRRARDCHHDL